MYARPNDTFDMALKIALLIDDPARREAMGRLGYQRIEKHLAWRYSVPNLVEAYRKILPLSVDHRTSLVDHR
jgi:glycosyltransferase involved in cell wall biosynthesis